MIEDAKAFGPAAQPSELLAENTPLEAVARALMSDAEVRFWKCAACTVYLFDEVGNVPDGIAGNVLCCMCTPLREAFRAWRGRRSDNSTFRQPSAAPTANAEGAKALEIARAEGKAEGRRERDAEALGTLKRIGMLMHEDSIIVQCGACECGLADAAPSRPVDCSCQPLRIRIDALLATKLAEQ